MSCHEWKVYLTKVGKGSLQKKNSKKVGRRRPKTKFYLRKKIVTWRVGTKINFVKKFMVFWRNVSWM